MDDIERRQARIEFAAHMIQLVKSGYTDTQIGESVRVWVTTYEVNVPPSDSATVFLQTMTRRILTWDKHSWTPVSDLHSLYEKWCRETGAGEPCHLIPFSKAISKLGYTSRKDNKGKRRFVQVAPMWKANDADPETV